MKTKFLTVLLITLAVIGLSWIYVDRLTGMTEEATNQYFYLSESNQSVTPSVDMSKIGTKKIYSRSSNQQHRQLIAPKVTNQPMLAQASGISSKSRSYSSTSTSPTSNNIYTKSSSDQIYSSNGGSSTFMAIASGNGSKSSNESNNSTGTLNAGLTNITKPFAAPAATGNGTVIVDPGGDPTGPPIPVGNGFLLLIIMSGFYGLYLLKFKK